MLGYFFPPLHILKLDMNSYTHEEGTIIEAINIQPILYKLNGVLMIRESRKETSKKELNAGKEIRKWSTGWSVYQSFSIQLCWQNLGFDL